MAATVTRTNTTAPSAVDAPSHPAYANAAAGHALPTRAATSAGVHPKVVSERLGHATVAITLDRYSHAVPALQAEAAEKVADLIFKRGS